MESKVALSDQSMLGVTGLRAGTSKRAPHDAAAAKHVRSVARLFQRYLRWPEDDSYDRPDLCGYTCGGANEKDHAQDPVDRWQDLGLRRCVQALHAGARPGK